MSKIEYEVPNAGHVTIRIVDIIGTQVRELKINHENAGKFSADLKGEALTPGKYYYKIHIDSGSVKNENEMIASGQLKIET